MDALIHRARSLVADTDPSTQVFSDQEVQDLLDVRRTFVRYALLNPQRTVAPGGVVTYQDYFSATGFWEDDYQLVDRNYAPINNLVVPDTSDVISGHWAFSLNQYPPVWILGKTYDVYGTAADLLEQWAAKLKLNYDFNVQQTKYTRSQQVKQLLELANVYRQRSLPRHAAMMRDDSNPDYPMPGPVWGE